MCIRVCVYGLVCVCVHERMKLMDADAVRELATLLKVRMCMYVCVCLYVFNESSFRK